MAPRFPERRASVTHDGRRTARTEENAHPHLSNDGRFAVVHNGIIENYLDLREELIRDGYRFESETDTEVIVHLIERVYRGDMREALIKRQTASAALMRWRDLH
jgi:glucosamine 6-phosphate synthetase-like amidotransferase/phosphosugar isomerase protein